MLGIVTTFPCRSERNKLRSQARHELLHTQQGLDKLRAREPASHASHASNHVSHGRQMLVPTRNNRKQHQARTPKRF